MMNAKQSTLLMQWECMEVGTGFHFKDLVKLTGQTREEIAPTVREIAALGYLEFMRGCTTDEGDFYGSAYVLTEAGSSYLHALTLSAGRTTEGGEV